MLGLCLSVTTALSQGFSDMFADSQLQLLTGTSLTITGSNTNATVEPGEPEHAGKIGGHSVWITWQAPGNGLLTLSTAGSSFDTLLGVYVSDQGGPPSLDELEGVAANDDYGGLFTSFTQFGVTSNQIYQIAVDGFNGATGDITLQLNFASSTSFQPVVVSRSGDQALRIGDPVILTVNLIPTSSHMDLQWYFNGIPVNDATSPTLVIPSLQHTNVGLYTLKIEMGDDNFFSSSIELQVNSEGQTGVLARNKLPDAAQSGLVAYTPPPAGGGVVLGYNGTQIFNTTNAVVDPNAPLVCGVPPGAAYWFAYQAPTNGIMTITTSNSLIPTLLAVFTYTGALTSYTNLIPVACDNNNGGTGTNTSWVQFVTTNGGNYYIVVGGVNGARGVAHLNYSLTAGMPPVPPVVTSQPQPLMVGAGTAVALSVTASGTAPLAYQWWKNNAKIRQQTNASLLFSQPSGSDVAKYFVVITNSAGSVTSSPAGLAVISAPIVNLSGVSNMMVSAFPGVRGFQYKVDVAATPVSAAWTNWTAIFPDYGGIIWITNPTTDYDAVFFRVHTP